MPTGTLKFCGYKGGTEGTLSGLGSFLIAFGIIGFVASLLQQLLEQRFNLVMTALGVVVLLQGLISGVLFRSGAEVIRLFKKLNGLNFSGQLSPIYPVKEYLCSDCDTFSAGNWCNECQKAFEKVYR